MAQSYNLGRVVGPEGKPGAHPIPIRITLFAAGWTVESPYSQTLEVPGVTAGSKIDLQPDRTVIEQLLSDGVVGLYIENDSGVVIARAIGAAPTVDLTVQATIMETAEGEVTA